MDDPLNNGPYHCYQIDGAGRMCTGHGVMSKGWASQLPTADFEASKTYN